MKFQELQATQSLNSDNELKIKVCPSLLAARVFIIFPAFHDLFHLFIILSRTA